MMDIENFTLELSEILRGVIVYVDVRSRHANHSEAVSEELSKLGALISKKLLPSVTHVLFKDGSRLTEKKARKYGALLLNVGWLEACKSEMRKVGERPYLIGSDCSSSKKKQKSMVPKDFNEEVKSASEKLENRAKRRRSGITLPEPLGHIAADNINLLDLMSAPRTPPAMQRRLNELKQRIPSSPLIRGSESLIRDVNGAKLVSNSVRQNSPDYGVSPDLVPPADLRSPAAGYRNTTDVWCSCTTKTPAVSEARSSRYWKAADTTAELSPRVVFDPASEISGAFEPANETSGALDSEANNDFESLVSYHSMAVTLSPSTATSSESVLSSVNLVASTLSVAESPKTELDGSVVPESPLLFSPVSPEAVASSLSKAGCRKICVSSSMLESPVHIPDIDTQEYLDSSELRVSASPETSDSSLVLPVEPSHPSAAPRRKTLGTRCRPRVSSKPEPPTAFSSTTLVIPRSDEKVDHSQSAMTSAITCLGTPGDFLVNANTSQGINSPVRMLELSSTTEELPSQTQRSEGRVSKTGKHSEEFTSIRKSPPASPEISLTSNPLRRKSIQLPLKYSIPTDSAKHGRCMSRLNSISPISEPLSRPKSRDPSLLLLSSDSDEKENAPAELLVFATAGKKALYQWDIRSPLRLMKDNLTEEESPTLHPSLTTRNRVPGNTQKNARKNARPDRRRVTKRQQPPEVRAPRCRKSICVVVHEDAPGENENPVSTPRSPGIRKPLTLIDAEGMIRSPLGDLNRDTISRSREFMEKRKPIESSSTEIVKHEKSYCVPTEKNNVHSSGSSNRSDTRPSISARHSLDTHTSLKLGEGLKKPIDELIPSADPLQSRNEASRVADPASDPLWATSRVAPDSTTSHGVRTSMRSKRSSSNRTTASLVSAQGEDEIWITSEKSRATTSQTAAHSSRPRPSKRSESLCSGSMESQNSSASSRRGRPNIVLTSLHTHERLEIKSTVKLLGYYRINSEVDENTQLVVCGDNRRTLNVLRGISRGARLVTPDWVYDSCHASMWLQPDAGKYSMRSHFPAASSQSSTASSPGEKDRHLFKAIGAVFVSPISTPSQRDLQDLILLNGGTVSKTRRGSRLQVGRSVDDPLRSEIVRESWVLDCVSHRRLLDYRFYRLHPTRAGSTSEGSSANNDDDFNSVFV